MELIVQHMVLVALEEGQSAHYLLQLVRFSIYLLVVREHQEQLAGTEAEVVDYMEEAAEVHLISG